MVEKVMNEVRGTREARNVLVMAMELAIMMIHLHCNFDANYAPNGMTKVCTNIRLGSSNCV